MKYTFTLLIAVCLAFLAAAQPARKVVFMIVDGIPAM